MKSPTKNTKINSSISKPQHCQLLHQKHCSLISLNFPHANSTINNDPTQNSCASHFFSRLIWNRRKEAKNSKLWKKLNENGKKIWSRRTNCGSCLVDFLFCFAHYRFVYVAPDSNFTVQNQNINKQTKKSPMGHVEWHYVSKQSYLCVYYDRR